MASYIVGKRDASLPPPTYKAFLIVFGYSRSRRPASSMSGSAEHTKKRGTLRNGDKSLKPAILLHFDCVTHFKVRLSHRVDCFPPSLLRFESPEHKTSEGRLCHRLCVT